MGPVWIHFAGREARISMRKHWLILVLLVLLILPAAAGAETQWMVVSDLHYLAPSLYRDSDLFLRALRSGDGKVPQYGEELLSALYQEISERRPQALIVTGDLTFNGEMESHRALAAWFKNVEDAGVPVWVIPGNHDINVLSPVGFLNNGYYAVQAVSPEEFAAIYEDFLMPGDAGFSYAAPIGHDVLLAMVDVAWYQQQAQTFGLFAAKHAAWLENTLKQAEGKTVITATHHSLIAHTEFLKENYQMFGHESMKELLMKYGVPLNLSGHLHIQHIAREDGLADAALGAFCVWPHRFAVVTVQDDGTLTYEAQRLGEKYLPEGLADASRNWFMEITREKIKASSLTGSTEEIEAMAEYAAQFNAAYFSGTFRAEDPFWTQDQACLLWEKQENSSFWQYMLMVMQEADGDHLLFTDRK